MIPAITAVRLSGNRNRDRLPLLVLGPSLGTSAETLWGACARLLTDHFDLLGWDLPGHGHNRSVPAEGFDMAELAAGVHAIVKDVQAQRGDLGGVFHHAGDSVGGAVGLQLLLDLPRQVGASVLLCTGAVIGSDQVWSDRVEALGEGGTAGLREASAGRWFGTGFVEREPELAEALLEGLATAQDAGYAQVCTALAGFDVRDRLGEIGTPVLAVAGAQDAVTPTDGLREIAEGVVVGRLVELPGVAHLAPAEAPEEVARLIRHQILGENDAPTDDATDDQADGRREATYAAGLVVRREVLGEEHVDRAGGEKLTADFAELVTRYAWGEVWTRPGLDRRSRSMITLTALVAGGHHEELRLHLSAAQRNGLSVAEIKEVLLQSAIYCGLPAANTAFRIAAEVLTDEP